MPTCTVEEAVKELLQGRMIILVDDEDRENEGDLTMAAEFVTADAINFMAKYGRGLVCLALDPDIADRLDLQPMVKDNTSKFGTGFTVSIEAKRGVTTGKSAADRAVNHPYGHARTQWSPMTWPGRPRVPLRAKPGGTLVRTGQTGARWTCAGWRLRPGAVICEIMNDDGPWRAGPSSRSSRGPRPEDICTIADIIRLPHQERDPGAGGGPCEAAHRGRRLRPRGLRQ
jgi:3,4-dihydroxy 2-butanone 4-phosphate synthase/GTP cyclohydrolase II